MKDMRNDIFKTIRGTSVTAAIRADGTGLLAGTSTALKKASELGLRVARMAPEGEAVSAGDEIARFAGSPVQIAMAEDVLIGCIAKPSGIATLAHKCVKAAGDDIKIICGSWKKMPLEMKEMIRRALVVGGAHYRISSKPFVYLDKNYVKMLGGVQKSLAEVRRFFSDHILAIQVKGMQHDIAAEAVAAARLYADIIYIDSGNPKDIMSVSAALKEKGVRGQVEIAFGGNVRLSDIPFLKTLDVNILGIGREIIDAPLLDARMDVI
ncbi:MAG: hypothetical protein R6U50_07570 [Desulfobacterales bacterium]